MNNKIVYESDLTNFGTWWMDNQERCFRYWTYKRMYTPREQAEKYVDESRFTDTYAKHGYIKEAIELPDGDVLLGFEDPELEGYIDYRKLSEISLAYYEHGDENCSEEDYDDEEDNDSWEIKADIAMGR